MLTDSRPRVRVDQEGVRNFDLGEQKLVQLNGTADVGLGTGAAFSAWEVFQLVLLQGQTQKSAHRYTDAQNQFCVDVL